MNSIRKKNNVDGNLYSENHSIHKIFCKIWYFSLIFNIIHPFNWAILEKNEGKEWFFCSQVFPKKSTLYKTQNLAFIIQFWSYKYQLWHSLLSAKWPPLAALQTSSLLLNFSLKFWRNWDTFSLTYQIISLFRSTVFL